MTEQMDERAKQVAFIAGSSSPNWWMFQAEAGKIVDDIRKRFPNRKPLTPDL